VDHTDKYNKIVMGADGKRPATAIQQEKIEAVAAAIRRAGMDCIVSEDIEGATWEKFNYNCAFSVLTALYQTDAAGIRANPAWLSMMKALSEETAAVARALGIWQPADITDRTMRILEVMLPEGTSSMKRDVEAGRDSELELFSGTLCRLADSCGAPVPVSRFVYNELFKTVKKDDRSIR
jgi:2-dehydropantoate 2-reductase